jgi:hypothetical protein
MSSAGNSEHPRSAGSGASRFPSAVRRVTAAQLTRYLGALALVAVGMDHIEQYYADFYSAIPTIGTLFALNFASATLVAIGLVAPVGRIAGRWAGVVLALLAVAGIGIAAGSLAGLLVSENGGLFGFMEQGYREAIVLSIVLEVATIILLGLFLALNWFGVRRRGGRVNPSPSETRV